MVIKNEDSKTVIYIALGVGAAIALCIFSFGIKMLLGVSSNPIQSPPIEIVQPKPLEQTKQTPVEIPEAIEIVPASKIKSEALFQMSKKEAAGEKLSVESTFSTMEAYSFKIKEVTDAGLLKLEYDKALLGSPCSAGSGKGILEIPLADIPVCLKSTTCDAGETVCFKATEVSGGIKIQHTITKYDGEAI
ncbi:hypothetical protein HOB25_03365 [bacterium]|nr:hypothetical protein [bacterium]MBT6754000.1 hypothetical protein [bacterium]MBT7037542.1 hypothetical protein [bacterium]MBT7992728.1 hypothetical protein [bacterium]